MTDEFQNMLFERDEHIAKITFNRPPLNVLNLETMVEVNAALDNLKDDTKLKVLIFKANGKAFSAGVDVADHTEDKVEEMIRVFHGIFQKMIGIKAPIVALVDGAALGGGCEIASFCDIVLASERSKFGQPEIKVGVFPPIAAIMFPRFMNLKKALELNLTGDTISAAEAQNLGLVNSVFPSETFQEDAQGVIDRLTQNSSVVLQLTKEAILEAYGKDYDTAVSKVENIYLNNLMKTHDANEGLTAFMEKRKPKWKNE
jgi:cyclohexa-1,5-dienecarbonyl-CoA hydratase